MSDETPAPPAAVICPRCGNRNAAANERCAHCGQSLADAIPVRGSTTVAGALPQTRDQDPPGEGWANLVRVIGCLALVLGVIVGVMLLADSAPRPEDYLLRRDRGWQAWFGFGLMVQGVVSWAVCMAIAAGVENTAAIRRRLAATDAAPPR
ncbi:MAG TPA: hypothetical protein VFQ45_12970 [Longimicrobium sp.]|nr:hypothetical protein [Longimicrobium sp.]